MSDVAIRVANLSKRYRIGGQQRATRMFREALLESLAAPVRWLRRDQDPTETFWALDDVSFQVSQGEAVGIIGRNGAGKSTLLKVLSRITRPTHGRVDLYGRVASLLEVGTGFHPELTGRDNIYLNGAILGMRHKEIERKFSEIVDFSGVEKFLDTPVKHYSSGMYVRLAFAVAAHLEPDILVVDEVLAVGDAEFQKKCLGKMGDVASEGRTVLFVSHSMAAIRSLCRRGIILEQGRIKFAGSVDEAVNKYLAQLDEKETLITLAVRKDREGDGSVRTTGAQLRNLEHEKGLPATGAPTELVVEYEAQSKIQLSKLFVSITVRDSFGANLFTCSTAMKKADFFNAAARGRAVCSVEYLPLIPGHYSLSIKLVNGNSLADYITNAVGFEVIESGSSGFVNYAGPSWGNMVVPHQWKLETDG